MAPGSNQSSDASGRRDDGNSSSSRSSQSRASSARPAVSTASTSRSRPRKKHDSMITKFELNKNITFQSATSTQIIQIIQPAPQLTDQGDSSATASGKKKRNFWTAQETKDLIHGCKVHGVGNWKKVLEDPNYSFNNRSAIDLKDRFRTCLPEEYKSYTTKSSKQQSNSTSNDGETSSDGNAGQGASRSSLRDKSQKGANELVRGIIKEMGVEDDLQKVDRKERKVFTPEEDEALLKGFRKYGPEWKKMHKDPTLNLGSRRNTDIRDRFRNLYPALYNIAMDKRYRKKPPRNLDRRREQRRRLVASESENQTSSATFDAEADVDVDVDADAEAEAEDDIDMNMFMFESFAQDTGIIWTSYDDMVNEMANFDQYGVLASYQVDAGYNNNTEMEDHNTEDGNFEEEVELGEDIAPIQAVDPRMCSLKTPSVASGTSFTPSRLFSQVGASSPEIDGSENLDAENADGASYQGGEDAQTVSDGYANFAGDFLWDNMAAVPFFGLDSSVSSHAPTPEPTMESHMTSQPSVSHMQHPTNSAPNESPTTLSSEGAADISIAEGSAPYNQQQIERSRSFILKRPVGRPPKGSIPNINPHPALPKRPKGRPKGSVSNPNKSTQNESGSPKRPVGRPRLFGPHLPPPGKMSSNDPSAAKKSVGRPPKDVLVAKKPVGRPRKDGDTSSATIATSGKRKESDDAQMLSKKRKV